MADARVLQPAAQLRPDATPGRVDHDEVRRVLGTEGVRRGVPRCELHPRQAPLVPAQLIPTQLGARDGLRTDLDPGDRSAGRGHVQGEAADAAVEVPHRRRCDLPHPRAPLPVELRGHLGVGLEEALRAQVQVDVVDPHPQRLTVGEQDLPLPLEHGLVLGLQVDRDDRQSGQVVHQPRQVLADPGDRLLRAEHEAQHQLTVRRLGEQEVLQLPAAPRHVVRRQAGAAHERREHRQRRLDPGRVQRALTQIDALEVRAQDPQRRVVRGAGDDHLRLVAEAELPARDRRRPGQVTMSGQQLLHVLLLARQLSGVRLLDDAAGPAAAGREVGALHDPPRLLSRRAPPVAAASVTAASAGSRTSSCRHPPACR